MAGLSNTPEQRAILDWFRTETGKALIVAVAGAGKTTILLEGIKVLVTERAVPAGDILMATFSRLGARDMEARAAELAVPAGVEYRTTHSVALEMVRAAGLSRRIVVAKDWMLVRAIKGALKALDARDYGLDELPKPGEVAQEIGRAKAALVWPTAWTAADGEAFPTYLAWANAANSEFDPDEPETAGGFTRVVDAAYKHLEAAFAAPESHDLDFAGANARLLSFDDMLSISARAVLRAAPKDRWVRAFKGMFPWTLIDEVQDNNRAQWVLAEHWAGSGNLVCVGDDQQSIFGFRGSMPVLMRRYLDRGATLFTLSLNWRSGWKILDAANAILDGATDRIWDGGLVPGRGREFAGLATTAEYGDEMDEAKQVVADIVDAIESGTSPDEIAALYRLNASSGPLEVSLIARGIAYRIAGSSFFNRPVIRAALGYLAAALDEADNNGWRFGVRSAKSGLELCYAAPLRRLGGAFARQYRNVRDVRNASRPALGRWWRGTRDLLDAIDGVQSRLADGGLGEALAFLFADKADGGVGLVEFYRDEGAAADDETETDLAAKALIECSMTLSDPEELIGFALSMIGCEDGNGDRITAPRVTLSTVHKSKGLEWDRVYSVSQNEGLFPFRRGDPAEERRLAYVATTRAKKFCQVSWTRSSGGKPASPGAHALEFAARVAAHGDDAAGRAAG